MTTIPTEPQADTHSGLVSKVELESVKAQLAEVRKALIAAESFRNEVKEFCYENWDTNHDGEELANEFGFPAPSWNGTADVMLRVTVSVSDITGTTEDEAMENLRDEVCAAISVDSNSYGVPFEVEDVDVYDTDVLDYEVTQDTD